MESEQLFGSSTPYRNSYNSITSASSDEELLDGAGVVMDFHTTEDDNLLDGDASPGRTPGWSGRSCGELPRTSPPLIPPPSLWSYQPLQEKCLRGPLLPHLKHSTLPLAPPSHYLLCSSAVPYQLFCSCHSVLVILSPQFRTHCPVLTVLYLAFSNCHSVPTIPYPSSRTYGYIPAALYLPFCSRHFVPAVPCLPFCFRKPIYAVLYPLFRTCHSVPPTPYLLFCICCSTPPCLRSALFSWLFLSIFIHAVYPVFLIHGLPDFLFLCCSMHM